MRSLGRAPALALALAATLTGADGRGEPPTQALELFSEGRSALERGEFDLACRRFEESLALRDAVGPALNLADCEERRGHLVRALALWKGGAQRLAEGDPRRAVASSRARSLEPKLSRFRLAGTAPAGAMLRVDGAPYVPGVALDPGKHEVVVSTPGEPDRPLVATLAPGEELEVGAPPPRPKSGGGALLAGAITAAALGGAGLVGFVATISPFLDKKAIVDQGCPNHRCATQAGLDAVSEGKALGAVNAASLGVALAGLGVGAALLAVSATRAPPRVTAILVPTPLGIAGSLSVSF